MKFIKTVKRDYKPLFCSLFFRGYSNKNLWKEFVKLNYSLSDVLVIEEYWFYPEYHMVDFAKLLSDKIVKNHSLFKEIVKTSKIYENKMIKSVNSFDSFVSHFSDFSPALAIYFICDNFLEEYFINKITKLFNPDKIEKILSLVLTPSKEKIGRESCRERV